jgi:hypothetical protein
VHVDGHHQPFSTPTNLDGNLVVSPVHFHVGEEVNEWGPPGSEKSYRTRLSEREREEQGRGKKNF